MLDAVVKMIVTTLGRAIAALLGAVFRLPSWLTESHSDRRARYQQEGRRKLLATLTYDSAKDIVRKDGKERVRIVRDAEKFGAVLEGYDARTQDWLPLRTVGGGCIYDSVESAETKAATAVSWLKLKEKEPNQPPEPTAPSGRGSP